MALLRLGRGALGLRFRCGEGTSPWVEKENRLRSRQNSSTIFKAAYDVAAKEKEHVENLKCKGEDLGIPFLK